MTCEWLSQPCRGNTRACAFLVTNPPVAACVGKAKRHDAHARSLPPREVELLSTAGNALRLVNSFRHVVSPHHFRPAEVDLDTSRKSHEREGAHTAVQTKPSGKAKAHSSGGWEVTHWARAQGRSREGRRVSTRSPPLVTSPQVKSARLTFFPLVPRSPSPL